MKTASIVLAIACAGIGLAYAQETPIAKPSQETQALSIIVGAINQAEFKGTLQQTTSMQQNLQVAVATLAKAIEELEGYRNPKPETIAKPLDPTAPTPVAAEQEAPK